MIAGIAALAALWPPRAKINNIPDTTPPINAPTILSTPIILSTDPVRGDPKAALTIVEFSDFTCPHCAETEPIIAGLRQQYGARLKVIWKDLPILDRITGSRRLHVAARCAQQQDKFWEFHDALFQNTPTDDDALVTIVNDLRLDTEQFATCMAGTAATSAVAAGEREAKDLGITAAPTFFVNGQKLEGALTAESFLIALKRQ